MKYLFIDSTSGLEIGLLDDDYSWIEYLSIGHKKPSEIVHAEIYQLLKRNNLTFHDVESVTTAGPGSYTGMRLSEGIVQVLELSGKPVYSFYHFDVPYFSGVEKGFWVTNAFKGEVFIHEWDKDKNQKSLVSRNDYRLEDSSLGYTLDLFDEHFSTLTSTKNLIKTRPQLVIKNVVLNKMRAMPYYFRTIDQEFK